MRRYGLIFALIPAVLAASVGLAYYSYTQSRGDRLRVLETLSELAEEKVLGVESEILKSERTLFDSIEFDRRFELEALPAQFESALILDHNGKIVQSGVYSKNLSIEESNHFRKIFETEIVDNLHLDDARLGQRQHHHGTYEGRPMLFSYMRRFSGGRIYFLVLVADLSYLVGTVFPQFFGVRSTQLYQVVDQDGTVIYGYPFTGVPDSAIVEHGFSQTFSRWRLRVTPRDRAVLADYETRQLLDAALIVLALIVILGGLVVLLFAVRRERRLSQLKSDFISNVSHELKTPLSIISMFGEMLATGRTKSAQQATEYAEIIRRESVRLARLIDNVLDFAKIERGGHVYEFTEGSLAEAIDRAVEISKHRLERAEMEVELDVPDDLPEVRIDENAMTLAVLNLVDNALKYAGDGRRIQIRVVPEDKRLVLSVRDWGPGIEAEEQDQIFERFYRAKSVRLKPIRGSGIGLALVKHIAQAHGGDIEVESELGEGTTFRLWIPRPNAA